MKVSVVIPALNEEARLGQLLEALAAGGADEMIVADGGSSDATAETARRGGAQVVRAGRGRAAQMNAGAARAAGEVLWFLHADSRVPPDWKEQIARALADPAVVGGGFRVRIAAAGAGYRLLDLWGGLRAALERSFYGDQGIFARREVFERLGGFSQAAPLEDLEFSLRMTRAGKVRAARGPLLTSGRRWESQGFWRTVLRHSARVLSAEWAFLRGRGGPRSAGLERRRGIALFVVAKAPLPGRVKTRLVPHLTPERAAQIAGRMLKDTVASVRRLRGVELAVAVDPPEALEEMRAWLGGGVRVLPQSAGDLGARMEELFKRGFEAAHPGVVVLGSDHPGLPRRFLTGAVDWLAAGGDRAVLGPTEDGGYYLLGLSQPHPELLRGIPWSTPRVFRTTVERAQAAGLALRVLPRWFDVDRPEDLGRLPFSTLAFGSPPHTNGGKSGILLFKGQEVHRCVTC